MATAIAIFDTWLLMILSNVMVLVAFNSVYALTTRNAIGTWGAIGGGFTGAITTMSLVAALVPRRHGRRRIALLLLRILFAAVLAWLLWFQPQPWLWVNDYAPTEAELARQTTLEHLQQGACFLVFTVVFVSLGLVHRKAKPDLADIRPTGRGMQALPIMVAVGLALSLAATLFGLLHPNYRAVGGMVIVCALALMLFECARRVVRAEGGAFVAFVVVTLGMPLVLFLPRL
jgi:hypothetical protein